MLRKLLLCVAVIAVAGSTIAMGAPTLTVIPKLAGDTSNNANAITPDGAFVVGNSNLTVGTVTTTRGYLYPVGSASAVNVLSSDGAQSAVATGVGYRTSGGQTQVIISGSSSGWLTEWMTADGGTTFPGKRRTAANPYVTGCSYNALGSQLGSDAYYIAYRLNNNAGQPVYMDKGTGAWVATTVQNQKGITSPDRAVMNTVGASGRAVGWRGGGSSSMRNYMVTYPGLASAFFNGLAGNDSGQAISVSADGLKVFGQSPLSGTVTNVANWGYKVINPGASQTIARLPNFGDEAGSSNLQFPYGCSADGMWAVGMDYRGTEKAALWDTRDANPANWKVIDLTQFALANGMLDGFSRLSRGYSVGINGLGQPVVTGIGSWSPDGGVTPYVTRAFVMTVPEPATMAMLALGGLALVRRRR